MKKLLALLLALCLALTLLPAAAFAAGKSGTTDDGLSWKISNGTLTISGKGAMQDYNVMSDYYLRTNAPWGEFCDDYNEVVVKPGVTSVGSYAFRGLNLKRVTLPAGLTAIGNSAFSMQGLEEINLPAGLKTIGSSAFEATALKTVAIPGTVTSIGVHAFSYMNYLEALVLEPGIRTIQEQAFASDCFLTQVTIPASVTKVENGAFSGCFRIQDVYYSGTQANWKTLAATFDENTSETLGSATIHYVNEGLCVSIAVNTAGWPVVTWNAVSGAVKYQVYRATIENGPYSRILTTTGLKCTNSKTAERGVTYYYKVRAVNEQGTAGAFSNVVSATTRIAAPTGVRAKLNASNCPVVTWSAVTGAAKYQVYRATIENGTYSCILTTSGLKCTNIKNIEPGRTYYYKIRAVDQDGGLSAFSNVVSAAVKASAPTGVQAKLNASNYPVVTWNAAEGAVKYQVYRAADENGPYSRILTTAGLKCTNSKTSEPGRTYYYKIRSVDKDGNTGLFSEIVRVTTLTAGPGNVDAQLNDQGKVVVTWSAVDGAAKYQVYRSEEGGAYQRVTTTAKLQYIDANVKPREYRYKVRAVFEDGSVSAFGGPGWIFIA